MYVIVDASTIAYRVFYGAPLRGLENTEDTKEELINTSRQFIQEFCNSLANTIKTINLERPEFLDVFICWDGRKSVKLRRELYPAYKANRAIKGEKKVYITPHRYIDIARDEFKKVNTKYAMMDTLAEADDIIAILCEVFGNDEKAVVTRDRDMMQLVDDNTRFFDCFTNRWYSTDDVMDEMGVAPHNIVNYKAIVGDRSDNYFGHPGIGKKRGITILNASTACGPISDEIDIFKRLAKIPFDGLNQTTILKQLDEINYNRISDWESFCEKWMFDKQLYNKLSIIV